jgi:hypothetical protein
MGAALVKVAARELTGNLVLDFELEGAIRPRPGFEDEEKAHPDRIRVSMADLARRRFNNAALSIGIGTDRDLGLLHVAKVVADALVDIGALRDDRIGSVTAIDVYRYARSQHRHWINLVDSDGESHRRDFTAIAAEWRTPSPQLQGALRGRTWETATDYVDHLRREWETASESGAFRFVPTEIGVLEELGHRHAGVRSFSLQIDVQTRRRDLDLDNVALYVLDMLTLAMRDQGMSTPLDRVVGHIRVNHDYEHPDRVGAKLRWQPLRPRPSRAVGS